MSVSKDLYKEASRKQLRFQSVKGSITVEDLWKLPVTNSNTLNLSSIVLQCARELKEANEESELIGKRSKVIDTLQLKYSIAADILDTKEKEYQDKLIQQTNAQERARLLAILKEKQDNSDAELSIEELQAKINMLK